MRKFKVAAVQLNLGQSTPKIVADIKRYVKLAKKKGVKIICFPEDSIFAGPKKNETILQEIKKTCFEAKIWSIVEGHFHDKNKKCYNSAWLINEQGEIQGKHNKVHICDAPMSVPENVSAFIRLHFVKLVLLSVGTSPILTL